MNYSKSLRVAVLCMSLASILSAEQARWMRQPIRWVQTNLREVDAAVPPQKFVGEFAALNANAMLMALGGISAFYPSQVQFHYVNPYIPKGHDTFGEVLTLAHAHVLPSHRVSSRLGLNPK